MVCENAFRLKRFDVHVSWREKEILGSIVCV